MVAWSTKEDFGSQVGVRVAEPGAMPEPTTHNKTGMSLERSAELERQANNKAVTMTSVGELKVWLVRQGMGDAKADDMANRAWEASKVKRLYASREAMETNRKSAAKDNDATLAWLEILAGVVLLIAGLAAGWFVGLFLVPIIDGFRRLGS